MVFFNVCYIVQVAVYAKPGDIMGTTSVTTDIPSTELMVTNYMLVPIVIEQASSKDAALCVAPVLHKVQYPMLLR